MKLKIRKRTIEDVNAEYFPFNDNSIDSTSDTRNELTLTRAEVESRMVGRIDQATSSVGFDVNKSQLDDLVLRASKIHSPGLSLDAFAINNPLTHGVNSSFEREVAYNREINDKENMIILLRKENFEMKKSLKIAHDEIRNISEQLYTLKSSERW